MPRLPAPTRPLPFAELVLLLAAIMSMMAFSIDSTLPALPRIGGDLIPSNPMRAQLIIGVFVLGTGIGQLFLGPFSDSFGRRPAMILGVALFMAGALAGMMAGSLEALLAARFVQGFGAAASRVVTQATMRDLFTGRAQARVGSLVFTFFVMVPAVAPFIGQQIIALTGWRGLFAVYAAIGGGIFLWFAFRQPETLAPGHRRAFRLVRMAQAVVEVARTPVAMRYLVVMTLGFAQILSYISSAQAIFVEALGAGDKFPLYFAIVAIISGGSGFLNAHLVMRVGMRKLASAAFGSQVVMAGLFWLAWHLGLFDAAPAGNTLVAFILWSVTLFFMNGLTFGNVTALAMEPLGHIAGTASAVLGALSSLFAVLIATPIGLAFDGTPRALVLGVAICSATGFWLIWSDRHRERQAARQV